MEDSGLTGRFRAAVPVDSGLKDASTDDLLQDAGLATDEVIEEDAIELVDNFEEGLGR
jgi:hypothetical protein